MSACLCVVYIILYYSMVRCAVESDAMEIANMELSASIIHHNHRMCGTARPAAEQLRRNDSNVINQIRTRSANSHVKRQAVTVRDTSHRRTTHRHSDEMSVTSAPHASDRA